MTPIQKTEKLKDEIRKVAERLSLQIKDQKLRNTFYQCFVNTAETTVQFTEEDAFVITGDIPAMWLRDSAAQVEHYLPFLEECPMLTSLFRGVIARQARYIVNDPYVNAFNKEPNGRKGDDGDVTEDNPFAWERKYELDSLCSMLKLTYDYWKTSGDTTIFDAKLKEAFYKILETFRTEQNHEKDSPYSFQRFDCPTTDTLLYNGKGNPISYCGMIWSAFRPSDDACDYGYLIPANMFAVVTLGYLSEMAEKNYSDSELSRKACDMAEEVKNGIEAYGTVNHPKFGKIYAYETDGMGHFRLMDDANVPSLLSIPYIRYKSADDEIYKNTRRFVLSLNNPYYFEGDVISGVGSPHTRALQVWPISLCISGLTSRSDEEIEMLINMLLRADAGTGLMHESVHVNDGNVFSRPWFAWANSIFAEFIYKKVIAKS